MTRIAWMTDIHLNFLQRGQVNSWLDNVKLARPDALIISGDIGEAPTVHEYLNHIGEHLRIPVYFVLGNHDFYHSSIDKVRETMFRLNNQQDQLVWLSGIQLVELTSDTALIGHDGWSDGRYGNYELSGVMLNDYLLIHDLTNISVEQRLEKLNALGDQTAAHLRDVLPSALNRYKQIFIVMHPPPYREACWYEGVQAREDDPYLPHFSCKAAGDVLLEVATQQNGTDITVLCGHTHGDGVLHLNDKFTIYTGGAEYGHPRIARIFEL